jgi:hypothetical protein
VAGEPTAVGGTAGRQGSRGTTSAVGGLRAAGGGWGRRRRITMGGWRPSCRGRRTAQRRHMEEEEVA